MTQNSSKPKKVQKQTLKFSDGSVLQTSPGRASNYRYKQSGPNEHPQDPVTEKPQEVVEEKDEYDDLEYPPPSRNKEFRKIWAAGIKNITSRSNFDESHLEIFETYCSLIVTRRSLDEFIMKNGQTFRIHTLTGEVRRTYPEVLERNKTITQIAQYAKILDLLPKKDNSKAVKKEESTDWT